MPLSLKIKKLIEKGKYMIFMIGTKKYPLSTDSDKMIKIIQKYQILYD